MTGALLPVTLVALLTFWAGTFAGAATPAGALFHQTALLAASLLAATALPPRGPRGGLAALPPDPLRLGGRGRWLPVALVAAVGVATWASPVSRAGRVGLVLLPAYLLLPAAAARCWTRAAGRRLAASAFSLLLLAVAARAITGRLGWLGLPASPRAALPLGHHTLLAAWVVLVLPLAVAPLGRRGAERGLAAVAALAGVAGLATLSLSGSLLGALGVGAELAALAVLAPRLRRWAPLAALPLVPFVPRLLRLAFSFDPSALARLTYLEAGWRGSWARPWTGWGPGSAPWTIARWMRPLAGRNPPSEVIGDLHSLPAHLLYELGWPALLLAVALLAAFGRRRRRELDASPASSEGSAALVGLLGFAVVCLGAAPLTVPALPFTAAVVAGMALAAGRREDGEQPASGRWMGVGAVAIVGLLYVLPAALLLAPIDRAHLRYQRATAAASADEALAELDRAVELDPAFPLYRARAAWLRAREGSEAAVTESARAALEAARDADFLAPLWLGAGEVAVRAGQPEAAEAYRTAQRLDPLSPLAAFQAMAAHPAAPDASSLGARAVAGDRRLAFAVWWSEHPQMAARVAAEVGVPLLTEVPATSQRFRLGLTLDRVPALSFSLYAFRRSPWLWTLAPVEIALDEPSTPAAGT
jgi:tetratricopeptide (TPR) repeat protein